MAIGRAAPMLAATLYLAMRILRVRLLVLLAVGGLAAWIVYAVAGALFGFDSGDLLSHASANQTFTVRTHAGLSCGAISSSSHFRVWLSRLLGDRLGFAEAARRDPVHHHHGSAHSGYLDVLLGFGLTGFAVLLASSRRPEDGRADRGSLGCQLDLLSFGRDFVLGKKCPSRNRLYLWSTFFDNLCFVLVGFLACLGADETRTGSLRGRRGPAAQRATEPPRRRSDLWGQPDRRCFDHVHVGPGLDSGFLTPAPQTGRRSNTGCSRTSAGVSTRSDGRFAPSWAGRSCRGCPACWRFSKHMAAGRTSPDRLPQRLPIPAEGHR